MDNILDWKRNRGDDDDATKNETKRSEKTDLHVLPLFSFSLSFLSHLHHVFCYAFVYHIIPDFIQRQRIRRWMTWDIVCVKYTRCFLKRHYLAKIEYILGRDEKHGIAKGERMLHGNVSYKLNRRHHAISSVFLLFSLDILWWKKFNAWASLSFLRVWVMSVSSSYTTLVDS